MTAVKNSTSATSPVCSVCIANYNGAEVIEDCVNSVFAQDCSFPYEILVHDDASSDNSVEIVRLYYPGVTLITSEENAGFCVSNNRMAAAARGRYILLLNNDAVLFPDALRTLYEEAQRLPPAILGLPQYDAQSRELIDIGSLSDPFLNPMPNLNAGRRDVAMVSGACLWIPKTLWETFGGFPEWFHTLAEDAYLCFRARVEGYSVQALGSSGFWHWVGRSLGGGKVTAQNRLATTRKRRALSERNKSFVMALTYPAPLFQLIFPLHLLLLLMEGLILASLKREWRVFRDIYLGCIKGLWLERRRVSRLRWEIQSRERTSLRLFLSVFRLAPHKLRMLLRHGLPHLK